MSDEGSGARFLADQRLRLVAITSRRLVGGVAGLEERCAHLLGMGVPAIMLRENDLSDAELVPLAQRLRAATAARGALLLVNGPAHIALACGADGLHTGGGPGTVARVLLDRPPLPLLGASCHSRTELLAAEAAGAHYALLSPAYLPFSKDSRLPPLGPDGFRAAVASLSIPVLALGGIEAANAPQILEAGASGVAGIGVFMYGEDTDVEELVRAVM